MPPRRPRSSAGLSMNIINLPRTRRHKNMAALLTFQKFNDPDLAQAMTYAISDRKKVLPDGREVSAYSPAARKRGRFLLIIGVIAMVLYLLRMSIKRPIRCFFCRFLVYSDRTARCANSSSYLVLDSRKRPLLPQRSVQHSGDSRDRLAIDPFALALCKWNSLCPGSALSFKGKDGKIFSLAWGMDGGGPRPQFFIPATGIGSFVAGKPGPGFELYQIFLFLVFYIYEFAGMSAAGHKTL
jgi:hypothetical protein